MSTSDRVRLMICDDHKILADALGMAVRFGDGLELVAPPFNDPVAAIEAAPALRPDVVLMDVDFPGEVNGILATERLKSVLPEVRVVIMTAHGGGNVLLRAVEAGASAFLEKSRALEQVLDAVQAVARGETLIEPALLARLLREASQQRQQRGDADRLLDQLTDREREILQLLAKGMRNDAIAERLVISPQTAQTHVRNILGKLGVRSRLEAVTFAARHGIVDV